METQLQNHQLNTNEVNNNQDATTNLGGGGGGILGNNKNNNNNCVTSNYMCRQSSSRWTPTTDQIRILKDLYYNNGIRSPTADQIQRISARLRQYGKIEGKNVFYWFQNHKARERQKKRFSGDSLLHPSSFNMNINFTPIQRSSAAAPPPPAPTNHLQIYSNSNNHKQLYPSISPSPGVPCSTSGYSSPAGVLGVGQNGGCANYGSVAMEKSFRDCSISQGEISNCGWVGVDQYSTTYHSFLDKRKSFEQHETLDQENHDHQEEEEDDQETPEIETLPLFPMHGDHYNSNGFFKSSSDSSSGYYTGSSCYRSGNYVNGGSRASLELSLNSYSGWSMDLHH